jgi:hypothetical protein
LRLKRALPAWPDLLAKIQNKTKRVDLPSAQGHSRRRTP